jgi:hypothetical protein
MSPTLCRHARLDPGIHALITQRAKDVDGRDSLAMTKKNGRSGFDAGGCEDYDMRS